MEKSLHKEPPETALKLAKSVDSSDAAGNFLELHGSEDLHHD